MDVRIGTSGWTYRHWRGTFYPQGLRIGDADRERAQAILGDHYAAGRLDKDEYDQRLDQIWAARTRAELAPQLRLARQTRQATQAPGQGRVRYSRGRLITSTWRANATSSPRCAQYCSM